MNTDEIIRMAQEAGIFTPDLMCATVTLEIAERFADLVRADERKAHQEKINAIRIAFRRWEKIRDPIEYGSPVHLAEQVLMNAIMDAMAEPSKGE